MRADAVRNRQRILEAARSVFAERGADAQVDEVATAASLGVGTLYRHFPTKDALLAALVEERFAGFAEAGREQLARGGDPWEAFASHLRAVMAQLQADRGLQQVLMGLDPEGCQAIAERSGAAATLEELIVRAQAAGSMRSDFSIDHIPMVMSALSATLVEPAWDPALHLEILLDGLRARAA